MAQSVGRLGQNASLTGQAVETLPGEVTLSFVPYASGLQGWMDLARQHGHEVLIEIPMEPYDYPDNDPGPPTLLTTASAEENQRRPEYLLSRASGHFVVPPSVLAKFASAGDSSRSVKTHFLRRGRDCLRCGCAKLM